MQTYAICALLISAAILAGCSSNRAPQAEPAEPPVEKVQPDVPVGTGLEPSGSSGSEVERTEPPQVAQEPAESSSTVDSAAPDQSIDGLIGSVGRVLFGGSEPEGNEEDGPAEPRSVLSSVGRALAEGAVKAAREEAPDE